MFKNHINEKRGYGVIIAAVVCALALIIAGLGTGMYGAVRMRREMNPSSSDSGMAQSLLVDAAYGLKNSTSALRLCNEEETAEEVSRIALVHAVRAETALECGDGDWADNRNKEAFLNDVANVLHTQSPLQTVELADTLYECAERFYRSVTDGAEFEYDGELAADGGEDKTDTDIAESDISAASERVKSALECERVEYVGAFDGHIEFYTERDGKSGYAMVCGDNIVEYSFTRDDEQDDAGVDADGATELALATAAACGYDDLTVKWSGETGRSISVIMCKDYGGALACDDCATAVVFGGKVVSFTAGECDCEHKDIPSVKVSESDARKNSSGGADGVLVVRKVNGKERVCYEYKLELDDGVHYVYVCAENGKQMQVK